MENQNNGNDGQGNHDFQTQNFKNFKELDLDENPISQIDEDYNETNPNRHLNQENNNNSSNHHTSNDDVFIENPEDEFNIEDDFNDEDDFDLDKDLNLNDEDDVDDWNNDDDEDQEDLEGNELKRFENSSPEIDTTFLNRDL